MSGINKLIVSFVFHVADHDVEVVQGMDVRYPNDEGMLTQVSIVSIVFWDISCCQSCFSTLGCVAS